jgi:hypothetical protein
MPIPLFIPPIGGYAEVPYTEGAENHLSDFIKNCKKSKVVVECQDASFRTVSVAAICDSIGISAGAIAGLISSFIQRGGSHIILEDASISPYDIETFMSKTGIDRQKFQSNMDYVLEKIMKPIVDDRGSRKWDSQYIKTCITRAIGDHICDIIRATKYGAETVKAHKRLRDDNSKLEKKLKAAKRDLNRILAIASDSGGAADSSLSDKFEYPEIKLQNITFEKWSNSIPDSSGVYFITRDNQVVYVGRGVRMRTRLSSNHHVAKDGDLISWVEIHKDRLNYAEHFYIGILRPMLNSA